ncbi:DUF3278 domain-containing protein [Allobacillus sp. SKP2-8]|uniref:DUF3278 domain-containing protein n=1 Tax=unclassified Allobacillus TaxID=2628859 RepID=UPI0011836E44|nr:DUF3278 domain-containing protein [Allobacillus sp. SKP2-8]TSJ68493.1 DUF3278 domain-containing protein [Allobacillus sp. SKP2-8]
MKNKLFNRFIGVIDERDEYQQQEIHKELAFSGMILWILTMLLMGVSLVIDTIHNQLSFVSISLLIINMTYALYVIIKLRKGHVDETDCASIEEYEEKKNQLKKSSSIAAIMWGFFMLITMEYLFPYLATGEIDISLFGIIIWIAAAVFFGTAIYLLSKSKLKRHF